MKALKYLAQLLLTAVLFLVVGGLARAAPPEDKPITHGIVSPNTASRVLVFETARNARTTDGQIVVCPVPNSTAGGKGCSGPGQPNAWQDMLSLQIPGHVLVGYEYRTSAYYSDLWVYFKKR